MSKSSGSNAVGNVAIGLAVLVLGFVAYRMIAGRSSTATAAPATSGTGTGTNPAVTVAGINAGASLANTLANLLSSSGTTAAASPDLTGALSSDVYGDSTLGGLGSNIFSGVGLQDTVTQDSDSAMAQTGNSLLNVFGFSS
jgi:hypothetical protein